MEWKDEYQLSAHRYRELKHFCLQYYEWKRKYDELCYPAYSDSTDDPTADTASLKADYKNSMRLIEMTVQDSCGKYANTVFRSVTEDKPLSVFNMDGIELYRRRFFWLLGERKGI